MKSVKWEDLIGKKILAFRTFMETGNLDYVLFDDGKTWIELEEQDNYEYHDCSSMARILHVKEDKKIWKMMFNQEGAYHELKNPGYDPF